MLSANSLQEDKMKKIISVVLIACLCLALASCSSKNAVSAQAFASKAESLGLNTQDTSADYASYSHVLSSTTAFQSDGSSILWQADFLVANSHENAMSMFETNKAKFESVNGVMSSVTMVNYAAYERIGSGKYMYLSCVDSTLLYVNIDEEYMDAAKNLVKALGY